ncbi:MAG: ABC transporter ATP-binding protein [Parvibaculaceae bacterium]
MTEDRAEHVVFTDVRKSYDGQSYVVRGLDLVVRTGEFLTLLGPSGSGKTTSLMMLAGFESPTSGAITIAGQRIERMPAYRRNIGVVFQNYALFPHMTVAENVAFPLQMRKVAKAEARTRVHRALDMVRMADFGGRKPGQLSGGQQQRIALARALVFEPELVLMDEPLGALDKQLREHMQLEIKQLHARLGVTIVYVTHDQSEALTMSDRIGIFNDGILQQIAAPPEIYGAPANRFVAGFIGENNEIRGKVKSIGAGRCTLETAEGALVAAIADRGLRPDMPASLALRPEQVRCGRADLGNSFAAEVRDVIYHGDHARLRVKALDHDNIVIKIANSEIGDDMLPGRTIHIGWRPEDCLALPMT